MELALAGFVLVLGRDANRAVRARQNATEIRVERTATARLLTMLLLSGALLTLGAVWTFITFAGDRAVSWGPGSAGTTPELILGSGMQAIVPLLRIGGYLVQGVGAALLLRIVVDSCRGLRMLRRVGRPTRGTGLGKTSSMHAAGAQAMGVPAAMGRTVAGMRDTFPQPGPMPADNDERASPTAGSSGDIAALFRGAIQAGQLGDNERLPTVRQTARDFGVAQSTAARAYRALEREGLVVTRTAAGTRVASGASRAAGPVVERARVLAEATQAQGTSFEDTVGVLRAVWLQNGAENP